MTGEEQLLKKTGTGSSLGPLATGGIGTAMQASGSYVGATGLTTSALYLSLYLAFHWVNRARIAASWSTRWEGTVLGGVYFQQIVATRAISRSMHSMQPTPRLLLTVSPPQAATVGGALPFVGGGP